MSKPPPTALPRSAVLAAALTASAGFVATLFVTAGLPAKPQWQALPLLFVAALWLVPLGLALLRGERWAFILALGVLLFVTDATFRSRPWADKSFDWQVLMKGLVWAGCGVAGLAHLRRTAKALLAPPLLFTAGFVLMLGLSALWSPVPSYALLSAIGFACFLAFAAAAARVLDGRGILLGLALGAGLIVLPSLAVSPFAMGISASSPGSTGEFDRLRGLTDHPIPLAEVSAAFVFACLGLWGGAKGAARVALAALALAGLVTAAMTQSRIPPLGMAAAALGYFTYRRGGLLLMLPIMTLTVGGVLALESVGGFARLLPHDLLELVARSGNSKEILTLSGRLVIWPYVIERIAEAPWLGHGHAAGMELFRGFTPWKITHAHNAYLQALLYTGVVGFGLLALAVLSQVRVFLASPEPVRDILMLNVLILGLTEQSMVGNMPGQGTLLWMLAAAMAANAWGKRGHHRPVA